MDCQNVLHIIGDIASIITVLGGMFAFCKWWQSRRAKIIVLDIDHPDSNFYYISIVNNGPYCATNIKVKSVNISPGTCEVNLKAGENGQLNFVCHDPKLDNVYIGWTDGFGRHRMRVNIS